MKLEDCIKRIDRYMHSTDNHPRLVNVRNQEDMKSIYTHFKVGVNIFKDVSDYARNDENPSEETNRYYFCNRLYNILQNDWRAKAQRTIE